MIAKIKTGANLYGALAYNQKKVDKGLAKVLGANILCEPLSPTPNILGYIEDFEALMPITYRTEKPVIHISLNPDPRDIISDQTLTEIAHDYMREMGYENQPYLIFKHEDIDRHHIHIVSTQVDREGKKIDDSFRNRRSVAITERLEEKYRLHKVKEQSSTTALQIKPFGSTTGDVKQQIKTVVQSVLSTYKFQSMGEFRAVLSLYNIAVEEVKGTREGLPYHGILYCPLDSSGEKTGVPIKASLLGKGFGYSSIAKKTDNSKKHFKEKQLRKEYQKILGRVTEHSNSEKELLSKLKTYSIEVMLRKNSDGILYGVTFIDNKRRVVFNGSRIGKEFSANRLSAKLNSEKRSKINLTYRKR